MIKFLEEQELKVCYRSKLEEYSENDKILYEMESESDNSKDEVVFMINTVDHLD